MSDDDFLATVRSDECAHVIALLLNGEKPTTADLVRVLKDDGVSQIIIEYIADLHTRKVEGKRGKDTIASRSRKTNDVLVVFMEVTEKELRKGVIPKYHEIVKIVAKRTGYSQKTIRRYAKKGEWL